MTTSQVFADYLAMTPASAPWAFEVHYVRNEPESATLTATSPLAENPDHGWLYVLVQTKHFHWLDPNTTGFFAVAMDDVGHERRAIAHNPIHAVARVLIAADPTLRARLDACEDRKEYNQ